MNAAFHEKCAWVMKKGENGVGQSFGEAGENDGREDSNWDGRFCGGA